MFGVFEIHFRIILTAWSPLEYELFIIFFFFLIQCYVPFKIISAHMRRANE